MFGFSTISQLLNRKPATSRKYYGQFQPPQDQLLLETYFRDEPRDGVFIECGAFDGVTESSCYVFEESLGWSGINVEPCPDIFAMLVNNRVGSRNVWAALSDHVGEAVFYQAVHPIVGNNFGNGSLTHHVAHREELLANGCRFEEYRVPKLTYKELVDGAGLTRLDLFVLDVEGHELAAIDGMVGASVMPRVFCVEHGWLDIDLLDSKLMPLGFRQDRYLHNNLIYLHETY
jgi:FkbM family methyltransferase